jgi:hypothetical protein
MQNGKKYYFDMSAGALYSFTMEDRSIFAGVSMYNILKKAGKLSYRAIQNTCFAFGNGGRRY